MSDIKSEVKITMDKEETQKTTIKPDEDMKDGQEFIKEELFDGEINPPEISNQAEISELSK